MRCGARWKRMTRVERIRNAIAITDLLSELGYHVQPGDREQQFGCDLHGTRDTKPSARVYPDSNSWYCVYTGDRVLTPNGWVPLGDVTDCRPVLDGEGHFHAPIAYLPRGTRPCITLRTNAGYQVTVTKDHEVEVHGRGWVPAGEIRVGETLVVPQPHTALFNPDMRLPFSVEDLNSAPARKGKELTLPSAWSLELGEFMGYIFGDGWVTRRPEGLSSLVGLTSSAADAQDARKVFGYLQRWAPGRGGETHRTDETHSLGRTYKQDQYVFTLGNDAVHEWLVRLGLGKEAKAHDRGLPSSLWNAPKEALQGFLRGVYATDGSIFYNKSHKKPIVNLYSVSQTFLRDVQLLLLQFGIHSRLYAPAVTRPNSTWYLQLATGRDLLRFRDTIGIANERKTALLDAYQYNHRGSKPFKPIVVQVLDAGTLPVADLSMPASPTFVAGGIKVHNCFACSRSRDAISTVMDKMDLDFKSAMTWLEKTYNLPTYTPQAVGETQTLEDSLAVTLAPQASGSPEAICRAVRALLDSQRYDKALSCSQTMTLWAEYDNVLALSETDQTEALTALLALRDKVTEQVRHAARTS